RNAELDGADRRDGEARPPSGDPGLHGDLYPGIGQVLPILPAVRSIHTRLFIPKGLVHAELLTTRPPHLLRGVWSGFPNPDLRTRRPAVGDCRVEPTFRADQPDHRVG